LKNIQILFVNNLNRIKGGSRMVISGRNKLSGKIKDIKTGEVMAQITLDVNGRKLFLQLRKIR
jgi:hypothetical protein